MIEKILKQLNFSSKEIEVYLIITKRKRDLKTKAKNIFKNLFFAVVAFLVLMPGTVFAEVKSQDTSRKVIKYKKYTEVDLSGSTVKGKIRTPAVFYIFQRKRSQGASFVTPPKDLNHHKELATTTFVGALPK